MESLSVKGLSFGLIPEGLAWRETQVPGVTWIPLFLESARGPRDRSEDEEAADSTALIRMDPGCGYPPHLHLGVEEVLCLAGGYTDELGTVREGDYVRYEEGSSHAPVALKGQPCVLFTSSRGGIRILE